MRLYDDDLPTAWVYAKAARQSPERARRAVGSPVASIEPRRIRGLLAEPAFLPFASLHKHGPMTSSSSKPVITLDQLIALNDEIAALVRAGVPLDRGLRSLGEDLPGRLGRFARQLSAADRPRRVADRRAGRAHGRTAATLPCGGRGGDCGGAIAGRTGIAGRLAAAAGRDAAERRALADLSPAVVPAGLGPVCLFGLEVGAGHLRFVQGTAPPRQRVVPGRLPTSAGRPGFGDRWAPRSCWCWPGCGGWDRKARPWRKAFARLGSLVGFRGWGACCGFRARPSSSRSSSCWSRIACRWTRPPRWPQRPPAMRR